MVNVSETVFATTQGCEGATLKLSRSVEFPAIAFWHDSKSSARNHEWCFGTLQNLKAVVSQHGTPLTGKKTV
eukprot:1342297-Pyramimonas_sp.AAC.1